LIDNFQNGGCLLVKLLCVCVIVVSIFSFFSLVTLLLSVVILSNILLIFKPFGDDITGLLLSCGVISLNDFVIFTTNFVPILFNLLIKIVSQLYVNFFIFADSFNQSFKDINPMNLLFRVIMYFNLQIFK